MSNKKTLILGSVFVFAVTIIFANIELFKEKPMSFSERVDIMKPSQDDIDSMNIKLAKFNRLIDRANDGNPIECDSVVDDRYLRLRFGGEISEDVIQFPQIFEMDVLESISLHKGSEVIENLCAAELEPMKTTLCEKAKRIEYGYERNKPMLFRGKMARFCQSEMEQYFAGYETSLSEPTINHKFIGHENTDYPVHRLVSMSKTESYLNFDTVKLWHTVVELDTGKILKFTYGNEETRNKAYNRLAISISNLL